jgi:DNA-binding NarL/FixJ family response regulator
MTRKPQGGQSGRLRFSVGELRLLQAAADGVTCQELGMCEGTIRSRWQALRRRLGAHNRAQAVAIALRTGVIR